MDLPYPGIPPFPGMDGKQTPPPILGVVYPIYKKPLPPYSVWSVPSLPRSVMDYLQFYVRRGAHLLSCGVVVYPSAPLLWGTAFKKS